MIDIGVNLTSKQFEKDRWAVIERAQEVKVTGIILTGTDLKSSQLSKELAAPHNMLYSTAGVHPHRADSYTTQTTKQLKKILQHPSVVAVGECGLDFDRNFSTKTNQLFAFQSQLALAKQVNKPLFLHERAAHDAFLDVLSNAGKLPPVVIHCFTSNKADLADYLEQGYFIGITGWICDDKRGKDLQEAIQYLPIEQLMIETDAPYLTPYKSLGRRNEPKNLIHVAQKIAQLKDLPVEFVIEQTTANAKSFFCLQ